MSTVSKPVSIGGLLANTTFVTGKNGVRQQAAAPERANDKLTLSSSEKTVTRNEPKVVRNAAIGAGVVLAAVGADFVLSGFSRSLPALIGRAFLMTPMGLAIVAGLGAVGATVGANWHRITGNGGK